MARVDTTESIVLDRIIARLRSELGLDERTCYASVEPLAPIIPKGGPWFVSVSLLDGIFEEGEQSRLTLPTLSGNTTEAVDFKVTGYVRMDLDSTDHAIKRLSHATRGLLGRKRQILKALVGWDLLTTSGNAFLRSLMFATRSAKPMMVRSDDLPGLILGMLTVDFRAVYDWTADDTVPGPALSTMTLDRLATLTLDELANLPLDPIVAQ